VAEVVYLKKGERIPRSRSAVLVEVVSERSQESAESGPNGLRTRVTVSNFKSMPEDLQKKVGVTSTQRIYVHGAKLS